MTESVQSRQAFELLRSDLGSQAREANVDALLADPQALRALQMAMRLEPAVDELVDQLRSAPTKKSWFAWMDAWNLGGLTAASAAAAVMLLAPAATSDQSPELRPVASQQLIASDILTNASFEPSSDLFGGDFES